MIFLLFLSITGWILWSVYSFLMYCRTSVAGKTVLITGGSTGVGRCLVIRFLQLGARVIVWDYRKDKLDELKHVALQSNPQLEKSESNGDDPVKDSQMNAGSSQTVTSEKLLTCAVDFSSRIQLQRAIKDLENVHIVVNAVDAGSSKTFFNRSDESTEKIMLANTLCPLVLARVCLPRMVQQQDGHFVTIACKKGLLGDVENPDWAASRWASIGMHESIQMLIRQNDRSGKVRTTLVCPYDILRPSAGALSSTSSASFDPSADGETGRKPSGVRLFNMFSLKPRSFTPEEVADTCVWAICHGVERVFLPATLLLLPMLRVLPVPWFMWIISFL
ncbi:short-chain dehydrogenase [Trypanosoma grayi]|uniref:short-chain dehydrogenase n=1 Tax=Trypanosoma grayi TaxID=71804 RepID=UPI0004F42CD0|nr:short-chain dehydrogenase [Trypanosoma grayi]KEG13375.1 short-chain dehydrogenase [Trypanosoma grayi]